MYNKVILAGNLARDPELRYLPSGSAVCNTSIATNRRFKKQDGSQGEEVCFIDIAFFNRTAEIANQYLKRGSKVLIEGRLKLEQWTDQNGGKRSKHSVTVESMQMLDTKGSQGGNEGGYNQNSGYNQNNSYNQNPDQSNYGQNSTNSYEQQSSYSQNQHQNPPKQTQSNDIPDIDIDDDEIPF